MNFFSKFFWSSLLRWTFWNKVQCSKCNNKETLNWNKCSPSPNYHVIYCCYIPGFGSRLHRRYGSWFIRAIVVMFSKYGHNTDLEQLAKYVSIQNYNYSPNYTYINIHACIVRAFGQIQLFDSTTLFKYVAELIRGISYKKISWMFQIKPFGI